MLSHVQCFMLLPNFLCLLTVWIWHQSISGARGQPGRSISVKLQSFWSALVPWTWATSISSLKVSPNLGPPQGMNHHNGFSNNLRTLDAWMTLGDTTATLTRRTSMRVSSHRAITKVPAHRHNATSPRAWCNYANLLHCTWWKNKVKYGMNQCWKFSQVVDVSFHSKILDFILRASVQHCDEGEIPTTWGFLSTYNGTVNHGQPWQPSKNCITTIPLLTNNMWTSDDVEYWITQYKFCAHEASAALEKMHSKCISSILINFRHSVWISVSISDQ